MKRHIGKCFEINLGSRNILGACVWFDEEFGYLFKLFPEEVSVLTAEMVAETGACFLYGFLSIDAALRAKQAKVVKTDLKFKPYLPLLRAGGGVTPQGKLLDWYIYDGETCTRTGRENPILRSISNRSLYGLGALEMLYSERITNEEVFDRKGRLA